MLVPPQQVVVQIERGDDGVEATDFDLPHVGARRDSPGRVQRGDRCPQRADLVSARLRHLTRDVDLIRAHAGNGRIELDRRVWATKLRVDAPEAIGQDAPCALERQISQVDLADLRHDDEPGARDLELVRLLHSAGEKERDDVPGAQAVRRVDGAGEQGHELRGGATEHIDPKHVVTDREGLGRYRFAAGADEPRLRVQGIRGQRAPFKAETLEHAQHLTGWLPCGRPGLTGGEIRIEQVRGVAGGRELGADLIGRKSGLLEPLAKLRGELRVLLQQLSQLVRGHAGGQPTWELGLPLGYLAV